MLNMTEIAWVVEQDQSVKSGKRKSPRLSNLGLEKWVSLA